MTTTQWADPRADGLGIWRPTVTDRPRTHLTLLGTVVACALLTVAFLLAQAGGRALMCATHKTTAGHGALTYCHDYQPTEPRR